jgi:hypothetical protein
MAVAISTVTSLRCGRLSAHEEGGGLVTTNARRALCDERPVDPARCGAGLEALLAGGAAEPQRARVERRVLARALAERLHREASERGAPSADELERAAERAWPRHNDGPIVSVVHALFPAGAKAEARASALAAAVGAKPTAELFEATARAAGADVTVERIEAIGNRGRTAAGLELERSFADAAVRLTMDSPRSDVVHTTYGEHVILAIGRGEPGAIDASARAAALAREAIAFRARDRIDTAVVSASVRVASDAPTTLKSLGKTP